MVQLRTVCLGSDKDRKGGTGHTVECQGRGSSLGSGMVSLQRESSSGQDGMAVVFVRTLAT